MERIGVIADNHSRTSDGSDLPQAVLDAFAGMDRIVHCGDAGSWGTLDRLASVAPVVAVLGGHNGSGTDARVSGERRVVEIGGLRVGIVHDLVAKGVMIQTHPAFTCAGPDLDAAMREFFGQEVDLILYAGTHVPRIAHAAHILWVNPGSPTLPADRPNGSLGSVAVVEVEDAVVSARIVDLR